MTLLKVLAMISMAAPWLVIAGISVVIYRRKSVVTTTLPRKKAFFRKVAMMGIIAGLLLGFSPVPVLAQSQEGSVEIAKSAAPTDILTDGVVGCFSTVSEKLSAEKAAEFCLKAAKIEAERAKKIANEAADATKASRPMVVAPYSGYGGYGYGYRSYSYGNRYTSRRSTYRRPTSRPPISRPARPQK
ncbi:MAG: hypothetical protein AAB392_03145 [Patescibacteria group bacterium]